MTNELLLASFFALAAPLPDVPCPPGEEVVDPDRPGELHNPVAHMDITLKAYELYASRYEGGELSRYLGGMKDGKPFPDDSGTVVGGSFDEDKPYKNPFGELVPVLRHFWDSTGGPYKGYMGNDSSVNRAQKYFTGGFGLDGVFDKTWKGRGEGALSLYRKGEKARAYWYLGHAAHLVEDATVPAHVHLLTHAAPGSDAYETYMKEHFDEWAPAPGELRAYDSLHELFLRTVEITDDYDAGSGPGDKGRDGQVDRGSRRAAGFPESALKEEAAVLMPLAYRRVAELFVYFYRQVDRTPPKVTLADPGGTLKATATDEESGVDRFSYEFEYRLIAPGVYSIRASAADAAGNRGFSEPRVWRAPTDPRIS